MDTQPGTPELEKPDPSMGGMRFTGKPPGARARVIDQPLKLFSEPDLGSTVLAEVAIGCEVAIGLSNKIGGTRWIVTTLPSGLKGFIPDAHGVLLTKKVHLMDKSVNVHAEPSAQSPVITKFNKGDEFFIIDIARRADGDWYMIRNRSGFEGFIKQNTKLFVTDPFPQDLPVLAAQENPSITPQQQAYDWFFEIEDLEGDKHIYGINEISILVEKILQGVYRQNNTVVTHIRGSDGQWGQTKSTLLELAQHHFFLRVLYQPIKAYAVEGSKWGLKIGIALVILNILRSLILSKTSLSMFFLTANIIPTILVILSGGLVGYLLGMAVGGMIGMSKKKSIQLAKDANPEPENIIFKVVYLPFLAGCLLIVVYFLIIA